MKSKYICLYLMLISVTAYGQLSVQASLGSMYIDGDVNPVHSLVNSGQLGLSKSLGKIINVDASIGYGSTTGLENQQWTTSQEGGGLVEPIYEGIGVLWIPNYKSQQFFLDIGISTKYLKYRDIFKLNIGLGLGLTYNNLHVNIKDLSGLYYGFDDVIVPMFRGQEIETLYDNSYESKFEEGSAISPHLYIDIGFDIKLVNSLYLTMNARRQFFKSDYIDPIKYRTALDKSNDNDHVNIFSIGILKILSYRQEPAPK